MTTHQRRFTSTSAATKTGRRVHRPAGHRAATRMLPHGTALMHQASPADEIVTDERPWGDFQQFVRNEPVTVKIITVKPGHRLSLQRHDRRGELWQVLDGPIDVTLGERTWTALPGETVWVPRGAVHRMGNSGKLDGRVLEIGFGHFDEDDIHRLEDDYAR